MFVSTSMIGVPLALTPIVIVVIGFTISFNEEKARRVEFYLQYYSEEVLIYVRAKEFSEEPKEDAKVYYYY